MLQVEIRSLMSSEKRMRGRKYTQYLLTLPITFVRINREPKEFIVIYNEDVLLVMPYEKYVGKKWLVERMVECLAGSAPEAR